MSSPLNQMLDTTPVANIADPQVPLAFVDGRDELKQESWQLCKLSQPFQTSQTNLKLP